MRVIPSNSPSCGVASGTQSFPARTGKRVSTILVQPASRTSTLGTTSDRPGVISPPPQAGPTNDSEPTPQGRTPGLLLPDSDPASQVKFVAEGMRCEALRPPEAVTSSFSRNSDGTVTAGLLFGPAGRVDPSQWTSESAAGRTMPAASALLVGTSSGSNRVLLPPLPPSASTSRLGVGVPGCASGCSA